MTTDAVRAATDKMRRAGVTDLAVRVFAEQHRRLQAGETGVLAEDDIDPVEELPTAESLPDVAGLSGDGPGGSPLDRTVIIKLNGGLGTSMGMAGPKALLEVKDGLSFLDITARQVRDLRRRTGARLPLLLMHSFATRGPSLAALARHPDLAVDDLPLDFVQSKAPKLRVDDLSPVVWQADPELEWAPPGHGDLYTALQADGVLDRLLDAGYHHAFVANVDNLGAVLDPRILRWVAREKIPFLMEVAQRSAADRKGGHLARRPDGGLVLRELAQTPESDMAAFQDTARHRYFNTNTLWIDLRRLHELLAVRRGVLGLPMIVNPKTVDPTDPASTPIVQLETAMGAAIDVIDGARALCVPRSRFAPVKTTDDLLGLRSDAYALAEDGTIGLAGGRSSAPLVRLDPAHHRLIDGFEARFPAGPPSLVGASRLTVHGDVRFGAGVVVRGDVEVVNDGTGQLVIQDGAQLGP